MTALIRVITGGFLTACIAVPCGGGGPPASSLALCRAQHIGGVQALQVLQAGLAVLLCLYLSLGGHCALEGVGSGCFHSCAQLCDVPRGAFGR